MNCFNCNKSLPENISINFCPFCSQKLKCIECGTDILKDTSNCYNCGAAISNFQNNKTASNQIEFEQKGDSRKFKATFSDVIGESLVNTFGGMIGNNIPKKKLNTFLNPSINNSLNSNDEEAPNFEDSDELSEALQKIFRLDGDDLILQTSKLKESSKLDGEIRIALLTLLGYKILHNSEEIKRLTLTVILKKSKLNTASFRSWIPKCEEIVTLKGSMISLTPNGLLKAKEVLQEVIDPQIERGSIVFSKTNNQNRKKKTSIEAGTSGRSGKSALYYIKDLIDEGFFKEPKVLLEITKYLKENKAVSLQSNQISSPLSSLVKSKKIKRRTTDKGYEYYI